MGTLVGVRASTAQWLLVCLLLVVAVLLRVIAIESESLWTDEALTVILANWSIGEMILKPTDPTPFLYYALHKLLLPPDAPLAAMRSISVMAGVLSVALMYPLGRLAFGRWGGVLAMALLAVWSMHVDYSQEARSYSLLFLFTLLTSVGLLYYADRVKSETEGMSGQAQRRIAALAMIGAGNVLSFYTHVVSVYWIALTSLLLFAIVIRRRDRLAEVCAVFVLMALCAVPGLYWLLQQMTIEHGFNWLQQRSFVSFLKLCLDVFLPSGLWENSLTVTLGAISIAKALVVAICLAGLGAALWLGRQRLLAWGRERPYVILLITAYFLVPVAMWLHGYAGQPMLIGRGMLYSVPGMILLITGLCLALGQRTAIVAGGVAFVLFALSILLSGTIREREDWRGAYAFLSGVVAPGDLIALCPVYNYPALRYPATASIGAPVITMVDGRLAEIEQSLGADRRWDQTYFRAVTVPQMTARLAHKSPSTDQDAAVKAIALAAGLSIWRIDGHCNESAAMDRMLDLARYDSGALSFEDNTSHVAISIRQFRVTEPTSVEVRSLVAPRAVALD